MVVEDHDILRKVFGRWLVDAGHDVHLAADATEAMHLATTEDVDLALIDIGMPGKDGLWLANAIRQRRPRTQLAFVTGEASLPGTETLRPGVVGYILKPVERGALLDLVNAARHSSASLFPRRAGSNGHAGG